MKGCYDAACTQTIEDSPQTIKVTYVVQADPVTLTGVTPQAVQAGAGAFTMTLVGTQFSKDAVVFFNQTAVPTTYVSATQLTASISAGSITTAQSASVTVASSSQAYAQVSAPIRFDVVAAGPTPTISGLSPGSAIIGSPGSYSRSTEPISPMTP